MNNLYLIESDNYKAISLELDKILLKNNISRDELIRYDLTETNISDVINDLDTYGFFEERKVIYASDAFFLTTSKGEIEHNIDSFTKYINNPSPDNILIISCSKLDGKKNICKLVKEKFNCVSISSDSKDFIKKKTKGYKITYDTINYLIYTVGDNLERIDNELDKLLMYKIDDKEITRNDIDLIVVKKVDDNIFDLIDAIIKKNKKKSLTIYNEMVNYGEEVFKLLISLSNQIRLIYQVKVLRNYHDNDIADILNLKNPRQVYAIRQKISSYTKEELLDYLYKLALMDEDLKLGKSIDKIVFPIFIASL